MSAPVRSLLSQALNERPQSTPNVQHARVPSIPDRPASSTPVSASLTSKVTPIAIPGAKNANKRSSMHHAPYLGTPPRPGIVSPKLDLPAFDLTSELSKASVVKSRSGSVLTRGFILKTDYYPNGRALNLDINLGGAPNFRSPRDASFNVFGVAQPRIAGIKAILSLLQCRPRPRTPDTNPKDESSLKWEPKERNTTKCLWFNTREEPVVYIGTRPFVLRDASDPTQNLQVADSAEILEAVELRLKDDILREAANFGGLLLTHNEQEDSDGVIVPTWTAVEASTVKTSREVWESVRAEGWPVEYHRIPISLDRPIEDNYLDAYVQVIKDVSPMTAPIVFHCGMGAVRTTYAMVAACLVRRKQCIQMGLMDPYAKEWRSSSGFAPVNSAFGPVMSSSPGTPNTTQVQAAYVLEQAEMQREHNESLLRLAHLLQQCLDPKASSSGAIQILVSQPTLQSNLQNALRGNYSVVLSLLGIIDNGPSVKRMVDKIIDSADQVVNLREEILTGRIRYSVSRGDDERRNEWIAKSAKALEKYYFIIAFASYVESSPSFDKSFADWIKERVEIRNQILYLRKTGSAFKVFAPASDLKSLSQAGLEGHGLEVVRKRRDNVTISGGQILGDEWAEHVVKNRGGIILRASTLLKSDQWLQESEYTPNGVRGTSCFRNIPDTNIYGCGQPTVDAIEEVVERVKADCPTASDMIWITLREEPIILINGAPYCLRRENYSLRNMRDYGGISASRLEILEERLKDDVLAELRTYGGRILLHTEASDGQVVPVWEEARESDIATLKEVFASKDTIQGVKIHYSRVPITSERPPDFHDISDLMEVVIKTHSARTPIIVNCQLGKRRSTIAAIIVKLIQDWIQRSYIPAPVPKTPSVGSFQRFRFSFSSTENLHESTSKRKPSYQVINNLLRVIRNGLEVKQAVDDAIDQCAQTFDLHKAIENAKVAADEAVDARQRKKESTRGLYHLRQYFELIIFQAYLSVTPPDTWRDLETFEHFVKARPVFRTFEKELTGDGANALKPLERVDVSDGMAMPDEVVRVVANRSGAILSASTLLKSDFFSNLQKMSLPERIDGAPNFRRVPLDLRFSFEHGKQGVTEYVCGSGMPTVDGLRRALTRVHAGPNGKNKVFWTSLREEPVLYVNGRPHVLRRVDRPLQNMEATGITTDVVEQMEKSLKRDVQREAVIGNGRVLLHDEVEDAPGKFTITPQWETVKPEEVMTPRDVFELVTKEGYQVDYARVAITDEQAPLPDSMRLILDRVNEGLAIAGDLVFNCQMGRGRTTTGMVLAGLVAIILYGDYRMEGISSPGGGTPMGAGMEGLALTVPGIRDDGVSEEEAYLNGEYKIILQLVGLLSHGKSAKRLADTIIDRMEGVQNLRRAVFDYKLKADATDKARSPTKYTSLFNTGINYLYRYGMLIVFANYLVEIREEKERTKGANIGSGGDNSRNGDMTKVDVRTDGRGSNVREKEVEAKAVLTFPAWLEQRREIRTLLGKRSLD